jgi:hypothetical protein
MGKARGFTHWRTCSRAHRLVGLIIEREGTSGCLGNEGLVRYTFSR